MKRYGFSPVYGMAEYKEGYWVSIKDCIIAKQDNMKIGDSLDGLNEQIQNQIKDDGSFDVMIIMKKVNK